MVLHGKRSKMIQISILVLISLQQAYLVSSTSFRQLSEAVIYQGTCHISCNSCTGPLFTDCLDCASGYIFIDYLRGGKCHDSCPAGLYYSKESKTCMSCSLNCTHGCRDTANGCNKCPEGKFYDPIWDSCVNTCDRPGWYAVRNQGICETCPDENCLSCGKNGECNKCRGFWHLDRTSGKCIHECPTGYTNCDPVNPAICAEGWEKRENHCFREHLIPFCESYSSDNSCRQCQKGFFNNRNECVRCSDNCDICDSNGRCQVCSEQFYSNNGVCKECEDGCRFCNQSTCFACQHDFILENGTCHKVEVLQISHVNIPKIATIVIITIIGSMVLIGFIIALSERCNPNSDKPDQQKQQGPAPVILVEVDGPEKPSKVPDDNKTPEGDGPRYRIFETLKSKELVAQGVETGTSLKLNLSSNRLLQKRRKTSKLNLENGSLPSLSPNSLNDLNPTAPIQYPGSLPCSLTDLHLRPALPGSLPELDKAKPGLQLSSIDEIYQDVAPVKVELQPLSIEELDHNAGYFEQGSYPCSLTELNH